MAIYLKRILLNLVFICALSSCMSFQNIKFFNNPSGIDSPGAGSDTTFDLKDREFTYNEGSINESSESLQPHENRGPTDYDHEGRVSVYTDIDNKDGSDPDLLADTTDRDNNNSEQEYQQEQGGNINPIPEIVTNLELCLYTAVMNVNCREGDSIDYPVSAILMQGELATLVSINPELSNGKFELIDTTQCWVPLVLMTGPSDPLVNCLLTVENPPPPRIIPQDKPDCTSNMRKEVCKSAGGKWIDGGATSASHCECN